MNLMNMPMLWYFIDWNCDRGTHIMGFIGVIALLIACAIAWHQILTDPEAIF